MRRDPREEQTIKMERVLTSDLKRTSKSTRSFIERSTTMKMLLKIVGVLGVSLVMSGIFPWWMYIAWNLSTEHERRWCPHPCSIRIGRHSRVVYLLREILGFVKLTSDYSLNIVDASISTSTIIGVSCAILVLLFLIQPLGTARIGSLFAPIVIIWLVFNLAFGIFVSLSCHTLSLLQLTLDYRILSITIIPC